MVDGQNVESPISAEENPGKAAGDRVQCKEDGQSDGPGQGGESPEELPDKVDKLSEAKG
jgi:hypothetical protein